jgi:GR25 family glycosyltransferase involved in LPS biosynthesis
MLSQRLISFHDRVFAISFDGATDRQENLSRQLGAGAYELVLGLNKDKVSTEMLIAEGVYTDMPRRDSFFHDREMTLGGVCCTFGHHEVYRRIIESGCQRALVFEDDVIAFEVSEFDISAALSNVPPDAELILWGWSGSRFAPMFAEFQKAIYHINRAFGRFRHSHKLIRNMYIRPYNEHFYIAADNHLAHAYTITRSAAQTLLNWNTPIWQIADQAIADATLSGNVRSYLARRQLFGQRSLDPDDKIQSLTRP